MKLGSLKTKMVAGFLSVVALFALSVAALGIKVIKRNIIGRAQENLELNMRTALTIYGEEIEGLARSFRLVSLENDTESLKRNMGLDYLKRLDRARALTSSDEIVRSALAERRGVGGTRIVPAEEIAVMEEAVRIKADIHIRETRRARPATRDRLESALAKEYALPFLDERGEVASVLVGGRIINQDFQRVDRFRDMIFGDRSYKDRPAGTVTIFQDDVRVATNVLTEDGYRAVGTRISAEVYRAVVEEGRTWHDRAFVVRDWYRSAYEPIRNVDGRIIGILYVGILEQPFNDLARRISLVFLALVAGAAGLAVSLSLLLAGRISRPMAAFQAAARTIADGDFGHRVGTQTGIRDFDGLAESFNSMTEKLDEREKNLKQANRMLEEANQKYIDLIGFVSHELKGILSSAVMNTYSIRDGYLGMINFKQRKAVDAIARTLDYLSATVKKFLNLGRIERGELPVNLRPLRIRKDVFDVALDSLAAQAKAKGMRIHNGIDPELEVNADPDLMQIAANNLVGNAIKYGDPGGRIFLSSTIESGRLAIEVYNDAPPIPAEQIDRLFKKFARLNNEATRRVKGTGLGLFITRRIIEAHGGSIRVEPRDKGNAFIFEIERS